MRKIPGMLKLFHVFFFYPEVILNIIDKIGEGFFKNLLPLPGLYGIVKVVDKSDEFPVWSSVSLTLTLSSSFHVMSGMLACFPICVFNTTHAGGNGQRSPASAGTGIPDFTRVIIPARHRQATYKRSCRSWIQGGFASTFVAVRGIGPARRVREDE
jgi:hypothetical protein